MPLAERAANYFSLGGNPCDGNRHAVCNERPARRRGFVFASLLDRPLVPIATGILWHREMIPGPLAVLFSAEDFGGFLWALCAGAPSADYGNV